MIPYFTVAVTGHRPNRLHIGVAPVVRRLRWVLSVLRHRVREAGLAQPRAVSALAEGADRLFATAALDLGYALEALLPFPSKDYVKTFSDPGTTDAYRTLLDRASHIEVLDGSLSDSKAAYEAVGRATVDAADVLLTVWDGKGAAGRGGTPDIIAYAIALRRPVVWIDAATVRRPLLLIAPMDPAAPAFELDAIAANAQPLTRQRLAELKLNHASGS